jgi:hypothetical protein
MANIDTETTDIDWAAAERLAARLGVRTRELVAERNAEEVRKWALQNRRLNPGRNNIARSASYLELATLCGHEPPDTADADDAKPERDGELSLC